MLFPKAHKAGQDDWMHDAGDCLFCGQYVESRREEAGAPPETVDYDPCWSTGDGDFGCDSSPETTADGCGDHFRPWQIPHLMKQAAAAPEMLDLLKECAKELDDNGYADDRGPLGRVNALINRIESNS